MSTAILQAPGRGGEPDRRPGLARLTQIELRKMTDTRSGFWLQLTVIGLTVALVVLVCAFGTDEDRTLRSLFSAAVAPASFLLPVVGVLLVTSEWTQRTTLITFTLVPHRSRVVAAKLLAGVALSLAALVICLVLAVIGTAVSGSGAEDTWALPAELLGQTVVYLATGMAIGIGFGAVLLASAPAIVLYFLLPILWSGLGAIPALEDAARWLDPSRSLSVMTDHVMSATEWARAGTTLALWMVLPVLVGLWRIRRSELR